jgi:hypothetical protein
MLVSRTQSTPAWCDRRLTGKQRVLSIRFWNALAFSYGLMETASHFRAIAQLFSEWIGTFAATNLSKLLSKVTGVLSRWMHEASPVVPMSDNKQPLAKIEVA